MSNETDEEKKFKKMAFKVLESLYNDSKLLDKLIEKAENELKELNNE